MLLPSPVRKVCARIRISLCRDHIGSVLVWLWRSACAKSCCPMVSPRLSQTRLASLSERLPDAAEPGLWLACIVAAFVLAWWATNRLWIAAMVCVVGIVFAASRWVKMLAHLRHRLAEVERERAAMEHALHRSQKMEALGRLTVGVAHDFNNHLTVISSNVEMIARRAGAEQGRLSAHIDAAMQGVRRAATLAGRLLSFARETAIAPEPVNVDQLVNMLAELLRPTLGDQVKLELRLSGSPWFVWADVNRMENALLSLAVNVRDQVPDSGVLSVTVSNVELDAVFVAAHPTVLAGDYIQIAISGLAAPVEAKQWEPADDLSSAELFMARVVVREAGGCLLRSDPAPEGLSLRLFLPRYRPPPVGRVRSSPAAGACATILVVEDEVAIRSVCVETLRGQGYHVLEAPDAMEAFRLIADHGGIDLLFTDLGLPGGVSGHSLADAARNVDAGMRVLFTTGYERADLQHRATTALLRKPFTPAELAAKVRDALLVEQTIERSETVQG
jgi:CheY-like chemotaxis protein